MQNQRISQRENFYPNFFVFFPAIISEKKSKVKKKEKIQSCEKGPKNRPTVQRKRPQS